MAYKKGEGGRPKGAVNKFTKTVRDTVMETFEILQKDKKHSLVAFAKENPVEFYKIAAKLIPADIKADITSGGEKINQELIIKGEKFADKG